MKKQIANFWINFQSILCGFNIMTSIMAIKTLDIKDIFELKIQLSVALIQIPLTVICLNSYRSIMDRLND